MFQVTRRTATTLAMEHGSIKDVQELLRHADPRTMLKFYCSLWRRALRRTVNNWAKAVMATGVQPEGAPIRP